MELRKNHLTLRLIREEDKEMYYQMAYHEIDPIINYYTGEKIVYGPDAIYEYVKEIVNDDTRYDFFILIDDQIVGEAVINQIHNNEGNYRIKLYHRKWFNQHIGYDASKLVLQYAFDYLGLNEVKLEVYQFNRRAIHLYENLGFRFIKTLKDADPLDERHQNIVIMTARKADFMKRTTHNF